MLLLLDVVPRPQLLYFQHSFDEASLAHPGVQQVSTGSRGIRRRSLSGRRSPEPGQLFFRITR